MKTILIAILVWITVPQFATACEEGDCQAQFKKALDKVKSMRLTSKNSGFELDLNILITPETGAVYREHMVINSKGAKYKYTSAQFSLYQDDKTMVVIQHNERTVFLTRPLPEKTRQNQFVEMIKLQDSLQNYLVLSSCSKEFGSVKAGEGYMKIIFKPGKKIESTGLKAITYWLEMSTNEVKKLSVDYTPGSGYGIKRYEMIIEKMNHQSTQIPFTETAIAQAMRGDKLRQELRDYQLIDKRN